MTKLGARCPEHGAVKFGLADILISRSTVYMEENGGTCILIDLTEESTTRNYDGYLITCPIETDGLRHTFIKSADPKDLDLLLSVGAQTVEQFMKTPAAGQSWYS
jgi:hypothetical protein